MIRFVGLGLPALLLFALWLYCIFDVIAADSVLIRNLPKGFWLVLVIFVPTIGSIAWLALGRPLYASWRPGDATGRPAPRVLGPEDQPGFPARQADDREARLEAWEEELRRRERELRRKDDDETDG